MKCKQFSTLMLLFFIIIVTSGCGQKLTEPDNVVFVDQEIQEYIKQASTVTSDDLGKLYRDIVLRPTHISFGVINQREGYLQTINNLDGLKNHLELLTDADVVDIVDAALKKSNTYIRGADSTAYIFPADPYDNLTISMKGVKGLAIPGAQLFIVEINPTVESWEQTLVYTVAHEYHHVILGQRHANAMFDETSTLLQRLISEGRADSFAHIVYPEVEVPWTTQNFSQAAVDLVKRNLHSTDLQFQNQIMFNNSGYAIGFTIVQEFIKNNPNVTVDDWTDMPATEILEKSGYDWLVKNSD